jgi:hypothetical protein
VNFPTFEEALGVLELARTHDDSFGNMSYQLGHRPTSYPTIEQMRFILIEILAATVDAAQGRSKGVHDLCRRSPCCPDQ